MCEQAGVNPMTSQGCGYDELAKFQEVLSNKNVRIEAFDQELGMLSFKGNVAQNIRCYDIYLLFISNRYHVIGSMTEFLSKSYNCPYCF
jgi:hypothetical protein